MVVLKRNCAVWYLSLRGNCVYWRLFRVCYINKVFILLHCALSIWLNKICGLDAAITNTFRMTALASNVEQIDAWTHVILVAILWTKLQSVWVDYHAWFLFIFIGHRTVNLVCIRETSKTIWKSVVEIVLSSIVNIRVRMMYLGVLSDWWRSFLLAEIEIWGWCSSVYFL